MNDLTAKADEATDLEIRRLRWQCRRGMLELDHLLDRFLDLGYAALSEAQRATLLALLVQQDTLSSDSFMSRAEPPDPAFAVLIRRIVETVGERP